MHAISTVAAIGAALAAAAPAQHRADGVGCATFADAGAARQLVAVEAPSRSSTRATLTLWERDEVAADRARSGSDVGVHSHHCWHAVLGPWPARVGAGGLSARRHEGDGTTPLGTFRLGATVYGVAPDPGVRLRYHRLACGDWWDTDSRSPAYNRFRHVPCGASPPFASGERLWEQARAYAHFAVIEFNTHPARPGRGSAIFLHAATGRATAGCVSIARGQLARLLRTLRPAPRPLISIRVR